MQQALPTLPSWYTMVLLVLSVVELGAVVMLWKWKMMGFYMLVGVTALASVLSLMLTGASGVGSVFLGVISLVLLWLAMKPVWGSFK